MTTQFACVEVEEHDGLLVNEARGETGCNAMGDGWEMGGGMSGSSNSKAMRRGQLSSCII